MSETPAVTKPLSPLQARILRFVRDHIATESRPPSVREIMGICAVSSTSEVARHLRAIERHGDIRLDPGKALGIRLAPQNGVCPTCGTVVQRG